MEPDRYFVTVTAPSSDRLKDLATRGLDLFMSTARKKRGEAVIEGLMTLDDVATLVKDGYQVSVEGTMESRARAVGETTTLDAWLQTMGE
jgi:carboxypeptidase T